MAKTRQQKKESLDLISKRLDESNTIVISTFEKLSVNDDQILRSELREGGTTHEVVKKTLLKKIFEDKKIEGLKSDDLIGNISITSSDDEVAGAKVLAKFSKNNEGFKIVGGLLNKVWVDASKIMELAKLPSKQELIAKTVGTIKAPITGFVNVVSGNLRNLVNVLNNIKESKS